MSDQLSWVEVGELWEFISPYGDGPDHYLILQSYKNEDYGILYRVLHLETDAIIPDLIIDSGTVCNYKAHKIA
jgi:hypothetical protein